jgi:hypothetical protein
MSIRPFEPDGAAMTDASNHSCRRGIRLQLSFADQRL